MMGRLEACTIIRTVAHALSTHHGTVTVRLRHEHGCYGSVAAALHTAHQEQPCLATESSPKRDLIICVAATMVA